MDALITAAGRALSAGDPLGALNRVALRDDAPALALASRDLGWPPKRLDSARATLEAHGDLTNAAHARSLEARRLLLLGRLEQAEHALAQLDLHSLPPALGAIQALVAAGIALRRLHTAAARTALERAEVHARLSGVVALRAEVENAWHALGAPAARLVAQGQERLLLLHEVEALLASKTLVVDACRHAVRNGHVAVSLATRPVAFRGWPGPKARFG